MQQNSAMFALKQWHL